jgi:N6-adenosine-specific RNA methylase IME4
MEGPGFEALVADIRANGLRQPIILLDQQILDGRNRHKACCKAAVPIRTEVYGGNDPLAFVLSANLHRQHLNESQRAMVAAKLATLPKGSNQHASIEAASQPKAAKLLNVSRSAVQRATIVRTKAVPELVRRVELGEVAVSVAAKVAELPKEEQCKLATADEVTLRGATKAFRRATREQALANHTKAASAALGVKLYSVIYADPPWRFEPYSRATGMDRAADNHYPTMDVAAIAALKIPANDTAVVFLWATVPMLPEALHVLNAWRFEYRSHFVWVKERTGTGYWNRNQHELLLIGTRGEIPAPAPGQQFLSIIEAKVGPHSAKPHAFAKMIEDMFPHAERLEMFAREQRDGT